MYLEPQAGLGQLVDVVKQTVGLIPAAREHSWFGGRPLTGPGLTVEAYARARGVSKPDARGLGRTFEKRLDAPASGQEHAHWRAGVQWVLERIPPPALSAGEWNHLVDQLTGRPGPGRGTPFAKAGEDPGIDPQIGVAKFVPDHLYLPVLPGFEPPPSPAPGSVNPFIRWLGGRLKPGGSPVTPPASSAPGSGGPGAPPAPAVLRAGFGGGGGVLLALLALGVIGRRRG